MKKYIVKAITSQNVLNSARYAKQFDSETDAKLEAMKMRAVYNPDGEVVVLQATGEEQSVRDFDGVRNYAVYRETYNADEHPLSAFRYLFKE